MESYISLNVRRSPNVIFWLGMTLLCAGNSILADTITLKSGAVVQGTIVQQDAVKIEIQTAHGVKVIQKNLIKRIEYTADKSTDDKKKEEQLAQEKAEQEKQEREQAEKQKREEEERLESQRLRDELSALKEEKRRREDAVSQMRGKSGWPSVWRSMVLPGWGQVYRGDMTTARWFLGGAFLSTVYAYRANQEYKSARSNYDSSARTALLLGLTASPGLVVGFVDANQKRNALASRANRTNLAFGFLGAIYLTNVAEALFFRGGSSQSETASPDQVRVAFSVRF